MVSRSTLFEVPGGDTVQLKETAKALEHIGVAVDIKLAHEVIDYPKYDLLHFFNIIRPNQISYHLKHTDLPFVISTIFVDYAEIESSLRGPIFKGLSRIFGPDGIEYLKTLARTVINKDQALDKSYFLRGHKKSVEQLLNKAACLLPNSESEFKRLKERYRFENQYRVIPNGVGKEFFVEGESFDQRKGLLCIARIEILKNQLNLIRAVNELGVSTKIIGKAAPNHGEYYQECKQLANDNIEFTGQLSKEAVINELKHAKAHILPSFFETTGLSSLEAAACGCNIIVSPRGDTRDYFKDKAIYCDPEDVESIKKAIQEGLNSKGNQDLKNFVQQNYNWPRAAELTKEAYTLVLKEH